MNLEPKISVVTPSLNCAHMLKRCIEGVVAQRYSNFEHIVIDGGSNDGTIELLQSYPHIQWISERDRGEADALNKGFERVSGDIVCWLNADDQFIGNSVFSLIAEEARKNPDAGIFYGRGVAIDEDGKVAWYRMPVHPLTLKQIIQWTYDLNVCQPAMFFRKAAILSAIPLPPDLKYGIDNCIWLRMASNGYKFHFINKPLAYACLVRKGAKSSATVEEQITGVQQVTLQYLDKLSHEDRVDFWRDFYRHRFRHGEVYTKPIELSDNFEDLLGFAIAALELGAPDFAVQAIERLVALYPNSHEGFWLLGEVLNKKGMQTEAHHAIEHAARLLGAAPPTRVG
ncbi:MAG: glycosyltransferase [Bdellovibrionota bacterium]